MSEEGRISQQHIRAGWQPLIVEAVPRKSSPITFTIDQNLVQTWSGHSVLAAVLQNTGILRRNEFSGEPRAGFCMMGACQDCWMWLENGGRIRACTTPVTEGMAVCTSAPESFPHND